MFGQQLKTLRLKRGMSQEQLSKKLSLSRVTITSYENGARSPDLYTLVNIANYFDVSTDYLLNRISADRNLKFVDELPSIWLDLIDSIAKLPPPKKAALMDITKIILDTFIESDDN